MNIENIIYEVRGSKVIIDRDLASLIDYETKTLNQLVKRNIDKFKKTDYFQISKEEFNILKSQIVTSKEDKIGLRKIPFAFSKDGIKVLSKILRKESAIKIINEIIEKLEDKNELIFSDENAGTPVNTGISMQNMIYEIRGQLVMLDSDLAKIYECTNGTKTINLAVKRHANKFPERFMFQLKENEILSISRFQSETLNKNKQKQGLNVKYLPYAFTEQGVAMLATVLRTKVADEISVKIMDAFVMMRKYISNTLTNSNSIIYNHENRIQKLEETFNKLEVKKEHLFFEGQIYDAYSLLIHILSGAKKEIIIIDNYAGIELFDILKDIKCNIKIITKNTSEELIKKYNKQYSNVTVIKSDSFHDRFIIIDNVLLYHSGSSFKDLGKKCFAINKIENKNITTEILKEINYS